MSPDPALRREMLALLPNLHAFARAMTGHPGRADDLVERTILRALDRPGGLERNASLRMQLLSILRDLYHADKASADIRNGVVVPFPLRASPDPADMHEALAGLTSEQRESLLLVAGEGLGYEDAARICRTSADMLRSRADSGRRRLAVMLGLDAWPGIVPKGGFATEAPRPPAA